MRVVFPDHEELLWAWLGTAALSGVADVARASAPVHQS